MKRSVMAEGRASRPAGPWPPRAGMTPRCWPHPGPTLDKLAEAGPLPDEITVDPDVGYDSRKSRDELSRPSRPGSGPVSGRRCSRSGPLA